MRLVKGLAIAGLVIGYISIALFVVSIIIAVLAATTASASTSTYYSRVICRRTTASTHTHGTREWFRSVHDLAQLTVAGREDGSASSSSTPTG
jgi:hypothetical protein